MVTTTHTVQLANGKVGTRKSTTHVYTACLVGVTSDYYIDTMRASRARARAKLAEALDRAAELEARLGMTHAKAAKAHRARKADGLHDDLSRLTVVHRTIMSCTRDIAGEEPRHGDQHVASWHATPALAARALNRSRNRGYDYVIRTDIETK